MARSRSDWLEAGLEALVDRGLRAVAVEPLARRIGTTKGSFYWHFADRGELIAGVLDLWERRETTEVIERIEAIGDPRERLVALGRGALAGAAGGNAHASIVAAAAGDPRVAAVLERVTRTRLAFLGRLYGEFGFPPEEAARRARIAYAIYLGVEQLRRTGLESLDDLVAPAVDVAVPSSPDTTIIVAGHLRVRAADRDEFLLRSREAVELARRMPGCRDFSVSADLVDPERVDVYERWRDRAALEAFRGDGPNEELSALIVSADVHELEVRTA